MRIKEAARKTGLTEKTIRYYESRGLVQPDTEERNGRTWRDYTEEHIRLLEAVAILRKAQFHVEEIDAILSDPGSIPEVLDKVGNRVEEAYETLGKLRELMNQPELREAPDLLALAEELKEAVKPLDLPPQDLKFNFKTLDRMLEEEKRSVEETPAVSLSFGWVELCRDLDPDSLENMKEKLALFGIETRSYSYVGSGGAPAIPAWNDKFGHVPQSMALKAAHDKSRDSFSIEVRRRDMAKARRALRSNA